MPSILSADGAVCASIFDELPDVIVFTDPTRHVVRINPAARRVFGYETNELVGRKTLILYENKAEFLRQGRVRYNLKTADKPSLHTTNYRRKDGTIFPGETIGGPIRNHDGNTIGFLSIIRDISERVEAQQKLEAAQRQLEHLALTDELTGIANRRHFMSVAHYQFAQAQRYRQPLSLIVIDIDHFKGINDRYGHEAGDRVLQALCQNCAGMIRQSDLFGRIGGEEFAIMLPNTDRRAALALGKRLNALFREIGVDYDTARLAFTASLGIATLDKEDEDFEALLRRADRALYTAKQTGRDRTIAA